MCFFPVLVGPAMDQEAPNDLEWDRDFCLFVESLDRKPFLLALWEQLSPPAPSALTLSGVLVLELPGNKEESLLPSSGQQTGGSSPSETDPTFIASSMMNLQSQNSPECLVLLGNDLQILHLEGKWVFPKQYRQRL